MAYPRKLLGEGETVYAELRPHWKDVFWAAVTLVVLVPAASYVAAVLDNAEGRLAVAAVAVLVLLWFTARPFLRWVTTLYVITDRRVITRQGIVARSGRDMPMSRVNDVSFEHSGILDRVLRCGTLVVESAGERGQLVMRDVPHVEEVQRDIYRLAEADEERRRADYPGEAFGADQRGGRNEDRPAGRDRPTGRRGLWRRR
jgi:uncharacterized membrane protein YdbT with pleckstrin-like domain